MTDNKPFHIAIDGPVAAGKGTISRLVTQKLGFLYIDTGAMYRMAALLAIRSKVDLTDEDKIAFLAKKATMEMRNPNEKEKDGRLTTVILDGEDVSWKIRTEEVGQGASKVAQWKQVRQVLVKKQQLIAQQQNVIMEGRDITFRVLPHANLKIYLDAYDVVRARRRHLQLQLKGEGNKFEEVHQDIIKRDKRDMGRKNDPLQIVDDAWIIDTSDLSIDQVVDLVINRAKAMMEAESN